MIDQEIEQLSEDKLKKMIQIYRGMPQNEETKEVLEKLEDEQQSRGI